MHTQSAGPSVNPPTGVRRYFLPHQQWNHKIDSFAFNLIGTGQLKRGEGNLATLYLLQRGAATIIRHGDAGAPGQPPAILEFDADPWKDRLQPWGRPNSGIYQYVAINAPADEELDYQQGGSQDPLVNRAVSAAEWTMIIPSGASDLWLDFEHLRDIVLFVGYRHGSPEQKNYTLSVP